MIHRILITCLSFTGFVKSNCSSGKAFIFALFAITSLWKSFCLANPDIYYHLLWPVSGTDSLAHVTVAFSQKTVPFLPGHPDDQWLLHQASSLDTGENLIAGSLKGCDQQPYGSCPTDIDLNLEFDSGSSYQRLPLSNQINPENVIRTTGRPNFVNSHFLHPVPENQRTARNHSILFKVLSDKNETFPGFSTAPSGKGGRVSLETEGGGYWNDDNEFKPGSRRGGGVSPVDYELFAMTYGAFFESPYFDDNSASSPLPDNIDTNTDDILFVVTDMNGHIIRQFMITPDTHEEEHSTDWDWLHGTKVTLSVDHPQASGSEFSVPGIINCQFSTKQRLNDSFRSSETGSSPEYGQPGSNPSQCYHGPIGNGGGGGGHQQESSLVCSQCPGLIFETLLELQQHTSLAHSESQPPPPAYQPTEEASGLSVTDILALLSSSTQPSVLEQTQTTVAPASDEMARTGQKVQLKEALTGLMRWLEKAVAAKDHNRFLIEMSLHLNLDHAGGPASYLQSISTSSFSLALDNIKQQLIESLGDIEGSLRLISACLESAKSLGMGDQGQITVQLIYSQPIQPTERSPLNARQKNEILSTLISSGFFDQSITDVTLHADLKSLVAAVIAQMPHALQIPAITRLQSLGNKSNQRVSDLITLFNQDTDILNAAHIAILSNALGNQQLNLQLDSRLDQFYQQAESEDQKNNLALLALDITRRNFLNCPQPSFVQGAAAAVLHKTPAPKHSLKPVSDSDIRKINPILYQMTNEALMNLGQNLGLSYISLRRVNPADMLSEMLHMWQIGQDDVTRQPYGRTVHQLYLSLISMGQPRLAEELKAKYAPEPALPGYRSQLAQKHVSILAPYFKHVDIIRIRRVGTTLGLAYSNLQRLSAKDIEYQVLSNWISMEDYVMDNSGLPTIEHLVNALYDIGSTGTANDIKARFNP